MKWEINPRVTKEFSDEFPQYSQVTLQLLYDRGLRTQQEIDEFLNPDYESDLHIPFLMKEMDKTVERVFKAIDNNEKVVIYGDYDADGICASAIIFLTLKRLGLAADVFIPDRFKEGYGLTPERIKEIADRKITLLITVDCGITEFEEVKLANSLGIDVIITDHHLVPERLPPAFSILNPKQKDDNYPFKFLSSAGIAFKLAQAIIKSKVKSQKSKVNDGFEKWLLDLVAISTVADVVPLLGENRTLVKYGLVVVAQTKRIGLKKLMDLAGLSPTLNRKSLVTNIDSYSLGFVICPRINSASRIDHANTSFELLITENQEEADSLARKLNGKNKERQVMVDKIMQEVLLRISENNTPKIIFEGSDDWSSGIIGIVAGKLKDKFFRPVVIYSKEDIFSRASLRSIADFNIVDAMKKCEEYFVDYGGHAMAGGFTVKNEDLERVKKCLTKIAEKCLRDEKIIPTINIDMEVDAEEISWGMLDEIKKLEPFGEGNRKPTFLTRGLEIRDLREVGNNGKHLRMFLESRITNFIPSKVEGQELRRFKAIGFGLGNGHNLKIGDKIDVVFELDYDEWNGERQLLLKIIDLKHAK